MKKNTFQHPIRSREYRKLINVCLGNDKADLAIVNARLLNVYTGEILDRYSLCTKDKWIAYVGQDPQDAIGKKTHVIDAGGKTVIPGFIDGHAHLAWLYQPDEFLKYALTGGTTAIITETLEAFPISGYEGVVDFLSSLKNQPIKIFATAPAMVSISPATRGISTKLLKQLMAKEEIVGLGESYWQGVLQEPDLMMPLFEETLLSGKTLEGHSAGANGKKLIAYVATGISSCHEPIKAQEVLERLRLGLHVMIREGSIRRDLKEISKIRNSGADLRRLTLVTDGISPNDLMEKGYMEFVVQKAIDCGFDPISAIQMATLNIAEHFSLDALIGGIAPGRYADLIVLPDLRTITPEYVISNGQIIAQDGKLLVSPRRHSFSKSSRNSVHLPNHLKASDFSVKIKRKSGRVEVRIIDLITDLVTRELIRPLPIAGGKINADLTGDILKVAAIDRVHQPGKMFVGFIRGFGLKSGAIASSGAWDTSDIVVVGTNEADMALAVNHIHSLQGGAVVCENGKILAELPLPIFGLISDLSMLELTQKVDQINKVISALGSSFKDPLLTLITLTCAAIPYLRICEEGLVNLKDGQTVGLVVD